MNQTFNLQRFWLLLKLEFSKNRKELLFSSAIIIGLTILLMLPILLIQKRVDTLSSFHDLALVLCVFGGGSLFINNSFSRYGNTPSGISEIMVPASRFEKFLSVYLVRFLLAAIFIIVFWTVHYWFIDAANAVKVISTNPDYHYFTDFEGIITWTYCYFLILSVIFLGSLYFSKNAYVKSLGVIIIGTIIGAYLQNWITEFFTSSTLRNLNNPNFTTFSTALFKKWDISYWTHQPKDHYHEFIINYPEPIWYAISAFLILLLISLWVITYVRLKEKEI